MADTRVDWYESPRWSTELVDCSVPMSLDTYSKCAYGCLYCFSTYQKSIGGAKRHYLAGRPRSVNPDKVCAILDGSRQSQFSAYVAARRPFQWGGLADAFDEYERRYGVSLQILEHVARLRYPVTISTKGAWWTADDRYRRLVRDSQDWCNVTISVITLDAAKAAAVERGCPTPQERIEAMRNLAELNVQGVILRFRPYIIGLSDATAEELVHAAADAGATAVSLEWFCLEQRCVTARPKYAALSEVLGFDIVEYYRRLSRGSGYLRLNRSVKQKHLERVEAAARKRGLRFYVSDAHYKERCDNGSCCGLPPEWNYTRGQWTEALQIARRHGVVHWRDIADDLHAIVGHVPFDGAVGYNVGSSERRAKMTGYTLYQHVRTLWNDPKRRASPYHAYEGSIVPDGVDEHGDVVYRYAGADSDSE